MQIRDAENTWFAVLEPLLKELFDTSDFEALVKRLNHEAFEKSPRALDAQFEELINRATKRPDLVIKHQAALIKAMALVRAVQESQRVQFRESQIYVAVLSVLKGAVSRKGVANAYVSARPLLFLDPTKVVTPAELSVLATPRPDLPFEQWAELLMREFTRLCETTLKTTLSALLGVVNDRQNVPTMVGQLIAECQAAWRDTPLLVLVNPEVASVRNAIAHEDFEIDLKNESITFHRRKKDGSTDLIGPWTREKFETWVKLLTDLLLETSTAFTDVFEKLRNEELIEEGSKHSAVPR